MIDVMPKISIKRVFLLFIVYFLGYLYLFPILFAKITLWFDPYAVRISTPLQAIAYLLVFFLTLLIILPVLKQSYAHHKGRGWQIGKIIIFHIALLLIVNITLSIFVSMVTHTSTSNNQTQIEMSTQLEPLMNVILTVIFAPVVEESIFRGGIFLKIREKAPFIWAALFSAFSFGLLHVLDSLSAGDFIDVSYLLVYAGLGLVLAYTFEKTKSLYACIIVHAISNFISLMFLYF